MSGSKNKSEIYDILTERDKEFIRRVVEPKPTPEGIALADKIAELKSLLNDLPIYILLHIQRRLFDKLSSFESIIDKKYWDLNVLSLIETYLRIGVAQSIEEAVAFRES